MINMKSALLIATTMMGSSLAFAPIEREINLDRCGKGLELRGEDGQRLTNVAVGHDFDNSRPDVDNSAAWDALVEKYGEGIKGACNKYNDKLIEIGSAMRVRNNAEFWVGEINNWATHIADELHDAGCAISEDDHNLRDMVKTMTYIHQQKLRMKSATAGAQKYLEKIQVHKNEWGELRAELTQELNKEATELQKYLAESKTYEDRKDYSKATAQLLGDTGSAKVTVGEIKRKIARKSRDFEELAHKIKRDSLRWSVLNQISNEGERLEIFARAIERSAYDVLSTCMVNYQKEAAR